MDCHHRSTESKVRSSLSPLRKNSRIFFSPQTGCNVASVSKKAEKGQAFQKYDDHLSYFVYRTERKERQDLLNNERAMFSAGWNAVHYLARETRR